MRYYLWTLALLAFSSVPADIPDGVLKWRSMDVFEFPGNDIVMDCARTADRSGFHAVVFNGDCPQRWSWYLVTFNRYGRETARTLLLENLGSLSSWAVPGFTDTGKLVLAYGSLSESGPVSLIVIDPSTPDTVNLIDVSQCFPLYSHVEITSVVSLEGGTILLAGVGLNGDNLTMLFTAELSTDGTLLWQNELFGYEFFTVENTTVTVLRDGTIMLSYEEDGFPGGIPVYRLDSTGHEMWQSFIHMDCEFTARCCDFLEMTDGDILCAGYYDDLYSGNFRGLLISMDPALSTVWTRTDWYLEHSSFEAAQFTEEMEVLVSGWAAERGQLLYERTDMDVLLAFVRDDGSGITGYTIEDPGNQQPEFVFSGGIGEYFIVGESTSQGRDESDVFIGRVIIER